MRPKVTFAENVAHKENIALLENVNIELGKERLLLGIIMLCGFSLRWSDEPRNAGENLNLASFAVQECSAPGPSSSFFFVLHSLPSLSALSLIPFFRTHRVP